MRYDGGFSFFDHERPPTTAPAQAQQHQPRSRLGIALVVFLPDPFRDRLLDAASVHVDNVSKDQRRDLGSPLPSQNEPSHVQSTNPWWVYAPTLDNYAALLSSTQFLIFFRNSAVVAVLVVSITMLISVPAAFALSRMRFWGSASIATGVFLTYLVPETLLFLPLFKMFAVFHEWTGIELINRWWVLLFIYPTLTVPFCTWVMIGYFASIPRELDEAALIDGANYRQVVMRIFIPVALPGIIAAAIFAFTVSWAQFLYPLAFTTSTDQLVLPVGIITSLIKGDVFNWGQIMTGALLGAAPPLVIYAFLMDYYIAGLTAGATKG